MSRLTLVVAAIFGLTIPVVGQWPAGSEPHPLRYFTNKPRVAGAKAKVQEVATLAGYRILDVLYWLDDEAKAKSILVQVGPDQYREIYYLEGIRPVTESRIGGWGSDNVLITMDSDGGNAGGCIEEYWWFDQAGPHVLDFSRLIAAIAAKVAPDGAYRITCGNIDFDKGEAHGWVKQAGADCHACGWIGQVTARFEMNRWVVEPIEVTYTKDQ